MLKFFLTLVSFLSLAACADISVVSPISGAHPGDPYAQQSALPPASETLLVDASDDDMGTMDDDSMSKGGMSGDMPAHHQHGGSN